jgi:hypothetical protein
VSPASLTTKIPAAKHWLDPFISPRTQLDAETDPKWKKQRQLKATALITATNTNATLPVSDSASMQALRVSIFF